MLRLHRHRWLPLPVALGLVACGRQPAAMPDDAYAQPPIPAVPTPQPAPLREAEISRYLQVMREAAQRVEHPGPAERQMLARADAITAAANRGHIAAGASDADVLARALAFRTQTDLQVARTHHLDPAYYLALSERIEDESGELYCDPHSPVPDPVLKRHVAEVEQLAGIVRNPGPAAAPPAPPVCVHE